MTIKNLTGKITFRDFFYLAIIIALLITLRHCGNQGASVAQRLTDSLRIADKAARDTQNLRQFRYGQDSARFAQAAQHARDSSTKAWAKVSILQEQIRQKQQDIGTIVPSLICDTCESHRLWDKHAAECCIMAGKLADQVDTLRTREAEKDRAANDQLTLAANTVNAQAQLLDEAHGRFNQLDSVYQEREAAARPRGSVWGGVETQVGPVSSAGVYLKYQTKRGKEYGIGGGRQEFGWYVGAKAGFKISLRKNR